MFGWFRRKRDQPKRGSRGGHPGAGRPGAGRSTREPTEYLPQGGGRAASPPPEPFSPPPPAEPWSRGRVDAPPAYHPPPPGPGPSRSAAPEGDANKTVFISTGGESADLVAALVGVSGVLKNRLYPVLANENHLGREGNGGIFHTDDKAISRDHGKLRYDDGRFHIRPIGDRTITVNGERLNEDGEFLRDGDMLQMGQTTFRFKVL